MLTNWEKKIINSILEVAIPEKVGVPISYQAEEVNCLEFIDNFLKDTPLEMKIILRVLFFILEISAIFFYLKPFSSLSNEQKLNFIHKWETNNLYIIRNGLKVMLFMGYLAYYSNPRVQQAIHFDVDFKNLQTRENGN